MGIIKIKQKTKCLNVFSFQTNNDTERKYIFKCQIPMLVVSFQFVFMDFSNTWSAMKEQGQFSDIFI